MNSNALHTARYSIALGSEHLPVIFRKRRGARHMVIRYQPLTHHVSVTLPPSVSIRQGLRFAEAKRPWLMERLKERVRPVPFACGQRLPVCGQELTLIHTGGRGLVRIEGDRLLVPGEEAFMARRVRDWVKSLAREEITRLAQAKAVQLGVRIKRISVRDTVSRWGSCSSDGALSFSWRLAFAPYPVMDYVVCHEVAHIKEHNHGPAFWKRVAELCPGHKEARAWLRKHGATLYAYG